MSAAHDLLVARLVQTITDDTAGLPAVTRFGRACRMAREEWARAALVNGARPPRESTRRAVLVQLAKEAILDLTGAANLRGEGGYFECLAIGATRASLGLDYDAHLICEVAHRELAADAERIRRAS